MSALAGSGPLITVPDLAAALARPGPPVVLDVRWQLGGPPGQDRYRAGHIPGAVFCDLDQDLAAPPGGPGGRHPLPAAAAFQAAMRRAGISDATEVVVYDDATATAAARAWWLLRYFGHPAVRVLDGGYRAWTAAGHPSGTADRPVGGTADSSAGSALASGTFTARPGGMPRLDAAAAAALARSGLLLDARAGERYRGETEPVDPVAGHVPGAVSAPTTASNGPDGRFLAPAELRARFAALGARVPADGAGTASPDRPATAGGPQAADSPDAAGGPPAAGGPRAAGGPDGAGGLDGAGAAPTVGAYCGSGVTAAHEVLALALAGIPASLYADSWSGWITDPARPVATGPEAG